MSFKLVSILHLFTSKTNTYCVGYQWSNIFMTNRMEITLQQSIHRGIPPTLYCWECIQAGHKSRLNSRVTRVGNYILSNR